MVEDTEEWPRHPRRRREDRQGNPNPRSPALLLVLILGLWIAISGSYDVVMACWHAAGYVVLLIAHAGLMSHA
jgi:hypothetical protein